MRPGQCYYEALGMLLNFGMMSMKAGTRRQSGRCIGPKLSCLSRRAQVSTAVLVGMRGPLLASIRGRFSYLLQAALRTSCSGALWELGVVQTLPTMLGADMARLAQLRRKFAVCSALILPLVEKLGHVLETVAVLLQGSPTLN